MDILTENRERLPQRKGLEGENDLHVGLFCHASYQGQVITQEFLLHDIHRRLHHHITAHLIHAIIILLFTIDILLL